MSELKEITTKSFQLSLKIHALYCILMKENQFDLAIKISKSNLPIRKHIDYATASSSVSEYSEQISKSLHHATNLRYWLKCIQMKNIVCVPCEECVEELNVIINHLLSLGVSNKENQFSLQPMLN
jgi:four helix bundle protein